MLGRGQSWLGVVVGYEKSRSVQEVLRWGAAEAAARKVPLTVCRAWAWPSHAMATVYRASRPALVVPSAELGSA